MRHLKLSLVVQKIKKSDVFKSILTGLGITALDCSKAGSFLSKLFVIGVVGGIKAMHEYTVLKLDNNIKKKKRGY